MTNEKPRPRLARAQQVATEAGEHKIPPLGLGAPIARLDPVGGANLERMERALRQVRPLWLAAFVSGRSDLERHLIADRWSVVRSDARAAVIDGKRRLDASEVVVTARLKRVEAILEKMSRFNEPVGDMLDIWGYRVIVADTRSLDQLARTIRRFWVPPSRADLLLRNGRLAFPDHRDYRTKTHPGLSGSTSERYDDAVHINRRAPFGIVEIQILTEGLFWRAFARPRRHEAHQRFVRRRKGVER